MKCLVRFRFFPFPRLLGESVFDSSMNISGCACCEWDRDHNTVPLFRSALHLEGGRGSAFFSILCWWARVFLKGTLLPAQRRTWGRPRGENHFLWWSCFLMTSLLMWWPEKSVFENLPLAVIQNMILSAPMFATLMVLWEPQSCFCWVMGNL